MKSRGFGGFSDRSIPQSEEPKAWQREFTAVIRVLIPIQMKVPRTMQQHRHRASNPSTQLKVWLHLHCSRFRQKGKGINMECEKVLKIMDAELENQTMASQRVRDAYSALQDTIDEYVNAVQEDTFYWGYTTAMKQLNA